MTLLDFEFITYQFRHHSNTIFALHSRSNMLDIVIYAMRANSGINPDWSCLRRILDYSPHPQAQTYGIYTCLSEIALSGNIYLILLYRFKISIASHIKFYVPVIY